jgi:hypothetical protein
MGPEEPVSSGAGAVIVLDPHHWLQYYLAEVGIANFFLSPLIANPLIFFGVR